MIDPSMAGHGIGDATARLLLQSGAVHVSREQPFILAAGWASPVYIDCRRLIGDPATRRAVTDLAIHRLAGLPALAAIVGAETAGMPWAAWIADRLDLPLRYVRKAPLGIGRNAQVEGGTVDGLDVLLIDDLTTDAASKVRFARGLRAAGARLDHALTIFQHAIDGHAAFPGTTERLAQLGLTLHSLATWSDLLRSADHALLAPADRAEIERFLQDPPAWSAAHGGRGQPQVSPAVPGGAG